MKGRKLLMIPGPVEFEPHVLGAMSEPTDSHVSPDFIECFGRALDMLKEVFFAPRCQPFVVAGSGTLAMEMAVVNLIEPEDRALVVSTGYFGNRYYDLLKRCGAEVTLLGAPIGDVPSLSELETALKENHYKLLTVTHVDTSTAVRSDIKTIAKLAHQYDALVVVDGVAAAAGEAFYQDDWGVDVYLTASQKAIGVPPGLAILMVAPRAMEVFHSRKTTVRNYYPDFANWLPIMKAYQARQASYFGTPPVNLIRALEVSLSFILSEGMERRFERHIRIGKAFRAAMKALGLKLLAQREEVAANTLSAIYYPMGVEQNLLIEINRRGVILAGGLIPDIRNQYFRVGHMGSVNQGDLLATIGAIEGGLKSVGYRFEIGAGLSAAQRVLLE
jgi:alanine-glyoxylate transaminase/serine-glyoxylate transaminase/serine-pyruvate transaminase